MGIGELENWGEREEVGDLTGAVYLIGAGLAVATGDTWGWTAMGSAVNEVAG